MTLDDQSLLKIINTILANEQPPVENFEYLNNLKTSLASLAIEQEQPQQDPFEGAKSSAAAEQVAGRRRSVRASKEPKTKSAGPKAPQPSAKRVVVDGRKRVVYVGPRGGQYVKRDGKFVRV